MSREQIQQTIIDGREADAVKADIAAVGERDARVPASFEADLQPRQGGFLETVGMMPEFRNASDRTQLGFALKQLRLAEQQNVNADRKALLAQGGALGRSGVVTGELKEAERNAGMFQGSAQGPVALEPGTPNTPAVITGDGQRLVPTVGPKGSDVRAGKANPEMVTKPVAKVPVRRGQSGLPMDFDQAVAEEIRNTEGFKGMPAAEKAARIERFKAKQRAALDFVPQEEAPATGRPQAFESDPSNSGLSASNLIAQEGEARQGYLQSSGRSSADIG